MPEEKPDIRKIVRVNRTVPAQEIVTALRRIAGVKFNTRYEQKLLNIDGKQEHQIGISSKYSYEDVIIRTGDNLDNTAIDLGGSYSLFGVGSTYWPDNLKRRAVADNDKSLIDAVVELVRGNLEEILGE